MSNKIQLQENNANLDALIERVNAAKDTAALLPDAGSSGGSSIETCTMIINKNAGLSSIYPTFYYTDASTLTIKSIATQEAEITVPTNTIVAITDWDNFAGTSSGSCEQLYYSGGYTAYLITGNCTLTVY